MRTAFRINLEVMSKISDAMVAEKDIPEHKMEMTQPIQQMHLINQSLKGHPGCTGVHQEKGRKLCHCWQLHEREARCGKRQAPLIGLEKTGAKMAGKPSKTKQPSLQMLVLSAELCVTFSRADIASTLLTPSATSFAPTALHHVLA